MKLLAFEMATEACSIALYIDGEIIQRHEIAPRRHAELALPWADELLAQAGIAKSALDAIAMGCGPGAFTGVRLAISLTQGIALALDRPLVPVSTLAALALSSSANSGDRVISAIDARMSDVYWGMYQIDTHRLPQLLYPEQIDAVDQAAAAITIAMNSTISMTIPNHTLIGAGSGWLACDAALKNALAAMINNCDGEALPHAAAVAKIAIAQLRDTSKDFSADRIEPAYLRNKVALTIDEQQKLRSAKKSS